MERIKRFSELYENELNILVEGRAFINAARKAKEEGLTEFEFKGKKYPVTIKDKDVSEESSHLDESLSLKVGDRFKHPVYKEIKGKVLLGPDTYAKIEKAGFDLPDLEDLDSAGVDSTDLTKKVWYGVTTGDGYKLGIHSDEIIKESVINEVEKIACVECGEINTEAKWKKNNGFCPSCKVSSQGVSESVNEAASKSIVKRKYTENHPSIEIQNYAPIREKVLSFLKENGIVTRTQLKEFINGMNEEIGSKTSMKWVHKNTRFIKEFATKGEVHYKLTPLGKRVVERMMVKESEDLSSDED